MQQRVQTFREKQLDVAELERKMETFLQMVGRLFNQAEQQTQPQSKIRLDEIELSVEIGGEGELKLVAGGKAKAAELSPPNIKSAPSFTFDIITVNAKGKEIDRRLGRADYFTEEFLKLDMVSIPGGSFMMGSMEHDSEKPPHKVTIAPFFMSKYAITQAQWSAISSLPKINLDLDSDPSNFKGANRPVEKVSWNEVVEFCDHISRKTGKTYRLPSEAEWEYACRAGTTTPFHFGETITTDLVNYDGNKTYGEAPTGVYRKQTTDVGSFPPNAFGLYDMHGNVWEWCADPWHENYNNAPADGRIWELDSDRENTLRLLRGGSWCDDPINCRSAFRGRYRRDFRLSSFGFRVLLLPAPRTP